MTDVAGRIAFVTGAARGIGLGLTQALLEAGARVVMADVDGAELAKAHAALEASDRLFPLVLDVRDRAAFALAADRVEREFGPVTLLFNNAGVGGGYAPEYTTYEHWDHTLGINVGGVVNGIQTFLQKMIAGGDRCHIVNTASGAGLAVLGKAAGGILYITSKYAVVGLSEALHVLMQDKNIGVSVFCPGVVSTDIVRAHAQLPPPARKLSAEEQEQWDQKEHALLEIVENGMPILEAGRIVLRAVAENQLFIHTSRVMESAFRQRARGRAGGHADGGRSHGTSGQFRGSLPERAQCKHGLKCRTFPNNRKGLIMDERISLIVKFTAVAGMEEALRGALIQLVEPSRAETGNLYYNLFATQDPKILIVHESWENKAASARIQAPRDSTLSVKLCRCFSKRHTKLPLFMKCRLPTEFHGLD